MTRQRGDDGIAVSPLVVPECSDAERRAVSLLVALHGHDVDDRRDLLRMLGLLPDTPAPTAAPTPHHLAEEDRPTGPHVDQYGHTTSCPNGHLMTAHNTRWKRNGAREGWRAQCRACDNAYKRRRWAERNQP